MCGFLCDRNHTVSYSVNYTIEDQIVLDEFQDLKQ